MPIDKTSTFSELKNHFLDNWESLPTTLQGEGTIFYYNVQANAKLYFNTVERELKRVGVENIKKSEAAKFAKSNLYRLYAALLNRDNWNAPRPTYQQFKKSNNEKM